MCLLPCQLRVMFCGGKNDEENGDVREGLCLLNRRIGRGVVEINSFKKSWKMKVPGAHED